MDNKRLTGSSAPAKQPNTEVIAMDIAQSASEILNKWLDKNSDKLITKQYRYAVTYGWIGGQPNNFEYEDITINSASDNEVDFTCGNAWCVWSASECPFDKWGNIYQSYEDGISLVSGCFEIGYADDSYAQCEIDGIDALVEDWQKFLDWCKSNTEHVDSLGDSGVSSGTSWSITYWTADIPGNSPIWHQLAKLYAAKDLP